jgi:NADPH-dependent glutamate synthase beta subunit-like oxidoreductase
VKLNIENNKVTGAECQRMELGEPDASGRRRPVAVAGSEFVIPADLVLTAIGEAPELSFLPKGKVELTVGAALSRCRRAYQPAVALSAGDCASGPATIVEAMASAKRAARSLERYVSKAKTAEAKRCPNCCMMLAWTASASAPPGHPAAPAPARDST